MKTIGKIRHRVGSRIFRICLSPRHQDRPTLGHQPSFRMATTACPILKGAWTAVSQAMRSCEATASGQNAECYGNTPADDQDPWNTRSQQILETALLTDMRSQRPPKQHDERPSRCGARNS